MTSKVREKAKDGEYLARNKFRAEAKDLGEQDRLLVMLRLNCSVSNLQHGMQAFKKLQDRRDKEKRRKADKRAEEKKQKQEAAKLEKADPKFCAA